MLLSLSTVSLIVALCAPSARAQGPTIQSCSWRLVPYGAGGGQTVEFAEVTCTWSEDLFVEINGQPASVSTLDGLKVTTTTTSSGGYTSTTTSIDPLMTYHLRGIGRLCCGSACSPDGETFYVGPSTTTSFLNFLASFSQINLPSTSAPNTLTFFIILPGSGVVGGPTIPPGSNILDLAGLKSCTNPQFQYGFNTISECQTVNTNSKCQVVNSAGVAAARPQAVSLGPDSTGSCSPAAVAETVALMTQVLDTMLPSLTQISTLGGIDQVMNAFLSQKSLVACSSLANSLFVLKNVTKQLAASRDCPYDYESQRDLYDLDPCCAWFSTKCCVPRTVDRTFKEIESVIFDNVNAQCASDVTAALGNLRLIAQDLNQRANDVSFGFEQLYEDYQALMDPADTCLNEGFFGWSQKCTKNGDCWSQDCDMSSAQYDPQGEGRCRPSDKPYEDFLRCIYSNGTLRADIQRQLAADLNVVGTTLDARVSESATNMLANLGIDDCVGETGYQYRAQTTYEFDSSGNYVPVIVPANATGCVAEQSCNYGYQLTQQTCVQGSPQFCARCFGTYCYEYPGYADQQSCEQPKCQLPNEWRLRDLTTAQCTAQTACSQTCEKCVSGWPSSSTNSRPTNYCFLSQLTNFQTCNQEGGTWGWASPTSLCYKGDLNETACAAQNGTFTTCSNLTRTECNRNTPQKNVMYCRWDQGAPCTVAECEDPAKGECDDWDLKDYNCGSSATCGRCIKRFPTIGQTGIVNDSWSVCQGMSGFTRYTRIGCGADDNSNLNSDSAACATAGGVFKTLATTQAECESEPACIRWGSSRQPMTQAQCTECSDTGENAAWGTMYKWSAPVQLPGRVVQLQWKNKTYGPRNRMVRTVPYVNARSAVESAVIKVLGRVYESGLRKKYSAVTQALARLGCSCLSGGSASDTAECTRLSNEPVSVIIETCNCDALGACDEVCPWNCPGECSYNVTRYLAAGYLNQNVLRRRLQGGAGAGYAPYETVKNSGGEIIGQTVGNAEKYAGVASSQTVTLCLKVDSFIEQSPAYTIYDFAPGVAPKGEPGVPLMRTLTINGGQICSDVPGDTNYWPVKRLPPGGTRSPTAPTTPRPAAPAPSGGSRVGARLVALVAGVLGVAAFW